MKKLLIIFYAFSLFACTPSKEELLKEITLLEQDFEQRNENNKLDLETGAKLFEAYDLYIVNYSKDSTSAELLMNASRLAVGLNEHQKAIKYLEQYIADFDDDYTPKAMLILGNYLANKVMDLEKAEAVFNQFLERYPNHPNAKDVKFMINTLGKTPEEILEMVQAKNDTLS